MEILNQKFFYQVSCPSVFRSLSNSLLISLSFKEKKRPLAPSSKGLSPFLSSFYSPSQKSENIFSKYLSFFRKRDLLQNRSRRDGESQKGLSLFRLSPEKTIGRSLDLSQWFFRYSPKKPKYRLSLQKKRSIGSLSKKNEVSAFSPKKTKYRLSLQKKHFSPPCLSLYERKTGRVRSFFLEREKRGPNAFAFLRKKDIRRDIWRNIRRCAKNKIIIGGLNKPRNCIVFFCLSASTSSSDHSV